jgi:hypothetical protein
MKPAAELLPFALRQTRLTASSTFDFVSSIDDHAMAGTGR